MRPPRSTRLGFQPPAIGEEEIAAVTETLRSGWLTTGPRAALLEERMAAYLDAEHVLAVASGTAALHLALLAVGVGPALGWPKVLAVRKSIARPSSRSAKSHPPNNIMSCCFRLRNLTVIHRA